MTPKLCTVALFCVLSLTLSAQISQALIYSVKLSEFINYKWDMEGLGPHGGIDGCPKTTIYSGGFGEGGPILNSCIEHNHKLVGLEWTMQTPLFFDTAIRTNFASLQRGIKAYGGLGFHIWVGEMTESTCFGSRYNFHSSTQCTWTRWDQDEKDTTYQQHLIFNQFATGNPSRGWTTYFGKMGFDFPTYEKYREIYYRFETFTLYFDDEATPAEGDRISGFDFWEHDEVTNSLNFQFHPLQMTPYSLYLRQENDTEPMCFHHTGDRERPYVIDVNENMKVRSTTFNTGSNTIEMDLTVRNAPIAIGVCYYEEEGDYFEVVQTVASGLTFSTIYSNENLLLVSLFGNEIKWSVNNSYGSGNITLSRWDVASVIVENADAEVINSFLYVGDMATRTSHTPISDDPVTLRLPYMHTSNTTQGKDSCICGGMYDLDVSAAFTGGPSGNKNMATGNIIKIAVDFYVLLVITLFLLATFVFWKRLKIDSLYKITFALTCLLLVLVSIDNIFCSSKKSNGYMEEPNASIEIVQLEDTQKQSNLDEISIVLSQSRLILEEILTENKEFFENHAQVWKTKLEQLLDASHYNLQHARAARLELEKAMCALHHNMLSCNSALMRSGLEEVNDYDPVTGLMYKVGNPLVEYDMEYTQFIQEELVVTEELNKINLANSAVCSTFQLALLNDTPICNPAREFVTDICTDMMGDGTFMESLYSLIDRFTDPEEREMIRPEEESFAAEYYPILSAPMNWTLGQCQERSNETENCVRRTMGNAARANVRIEREMALTSLQAKRVVPLVYNFETSSLTKKTSRQSTGFFSPNIDQKLHSLGPVEPPETSTYRGKQHTWFKDHEKAKTIANTTLRNQETLRIAMNMAKDLIKYTAFLSEDLLPAIETSTPFMVLGGQMGMVMLKDDPSGSRKRRDIGAVIKEILDVSSTLNETNLAEYLNEMHPLSRHKRFNLLCIGGWLNPLRWIHQLVGGSCENRDHKEFQKGVIENFKMVSSYMEKMTTRWMQQTEINAGQSKFNDQMVKVFKALQSNFYQLKKHMEEHVEYVRQGFQTSLENDVCLSVQSMAIHLDSLQRISKLLFLHQVGDFLQTQSADRSESGGAEQLGFKSRTTTWNLVNAVRKALKTIPNFDPIFTPDGKILVSKGQSFATTVSRLGQLVIKKTESYDVPIQNRTAPSNFRGFISPNSRVVVNQPYFFPTFNTTVQQQSKYDRYFHLGNRTYGFLSAACRKGYNVDLCPRGTFKEVTRADMSWPVVSIRKMSDPTTPIKLENGDFLFRSRSTVVSRNRLSGFSETYEFLPGMSLTPQCDFAFEIRSPLHPPLTYLSDKSCQDKNIVNVNVELPILKWVNKTGKLTLDLIQNAEGFRGHLESMGKLNKDGFENITEMVDELSKLIPTLDEFNSRLLSSIAKDEMVTKAFNDRIALLEETTRNRDETKHTSVVVWVLLAFSLSLGIGSMILHLGRFARATEYGNGTLIGLSLACSSYCEETLPNPTMELVFLGWAVSSFLVSMAQHLFENYHNQKNSIKYVVSLIRFGGEVPVQAYTLMDQLCNCRRHYQHMTFIEMVATFFCVINMVLLVMKMVQTVTQKIVEKRMLERSGLHLVSLWKEAAANMRSGLQLMTLWTNELTNVRKNTHNITSSNSAPSNATKIPAIKEGKGGNKCCTLNPLSASVVLICIVMLIQPVNSQLVDPTPDRVVPLSDPITTNKPNMFKIDPNWPYYTAIGTLIALQLVCMLYIIYLKGLKAAFFSDVRKLPVAFQTPISWYEWSKKPFRRYVLATSTKVRAKIYGVNCPRIIQIYTPMTTCETMDFAKSKVNKQMLDLNIVEKKQCKKVVLTVKNETFFDGLTTYLGLRPAKKRACLPCVKSAVHSAKLDENFLKTSSNTIESLEIIKSNFCGVDTIDRTVMLCFDENMEQMEEDEPLKEQWEKLNAMERFAVQQQVQIDTGIKDWSPETVGGQTITSTDLKNLVNRIKNISGVSSGIYLSDETFKKPKPKKDVKKVGVQVMPKTPTTRPLTRMADSRFVQTNPERYLTKDQQAARFNARQLAIELPPTRASLPWDSNI
uniref:Glycoprotein n=1 Tax=Beihai sipunculid worm virus 7 TaxID=1922679 RepID=A0A1L3KPC2_9VIRU|nr:glycoprotein [Beihai sipunculid worm virus 7]